MRLNFIRPLNSITGPITESDVADYMVITGPNGSGKSNLLDAIEQGAVAIEGIAQGPSNKIRVFRLAQLVAAVEGPQTASAYRDRWLSVKQAVTSSIDSFNRGFPPHPVPTSLEEAVETHLVTSRILSPIAIERMKHQAGKAIHDFSDADYRAYVPLLVGVRDPFQIAMGELFLTYHHRKIRNDFARWLVTQGTYEPSLALSDSEFTDQFGPPPWQLLNDVLARVGLDYRFQGPSTLEEDASYEAKLEHSPSGITVSANQLSSGEKTLLAVAMSLYAGDRLGEAIVLPDVLLLDEADASLHPSMVKSLLSVTRDVFHMAHGVKIILTTHSPSTVALADEESLYVMSRHEEPRLRSVDRDAALGNLTVGLPTLSVRFENRRQVFVESEVDEECYQHIFRLLGSEVNRSEVSLDFIASGRGASGGCDAVNHLVGALRSSGNQAIWGIVDRDERHGSQQGVVYIEDRHSLENLVFDPLPLAVFLLRELLVEPEAMGLPSGTRHFQLTEDKATPAVRFVVERIAKPDDDLSPTGVIYAGGLSLSLPSYYLNLQGHALEERLRARFPGLNAYGRHLKVSVIEKGMGDMPQYVPRSVVAVFSQILAG